MIGVIVPEEKFDIPETIDLPKQRGHYWYGPIVNVDHAKRIGKYTGGCLIALGTFGLYNHFTGEHSDRLVENIIFIIFGLEICFYQSGITAFLCEAVCVFGLFFSTSQLFIIKELKFDFYMSAFAVIFSVIAGIAFYRNIQASVFLMSVKSRLKKVTDADFSDRVEGSK